jgi:hypothetical protein
MQRKYNNLLDEPNHKNNIFLNPVVEKNQVI